MFLGLQITRTTLTVLFPYTLKPPGPPALGKAGLIHRNPNKAVLLDAKVRGAEGPPLR